MSRLFLTPNPHIGVSLPTVMLSNLEDADKAHETHSEAVVPPLTKRQRQDAKDRIVSVIVVHEAIRFDGEEELHRPISALAWSGLAAGLSMGFSFVGEGLFERAFPTRRGGPCSPTSVIR